MGQPVRRMGQPVRRIGQPLGLRILDSGWRKAEGFSGEEEARINPVGLIVGRSWAGQLVEVFPASFPMNSVALPSSRRRASSPSAVPPGPGLRWICTASIALLALAEAAWGQTVIKANNEQNLDDPLSWSGLLVPGPDDIAVWNSTVTAPNTTQFLSDLSWSGLRIANPGGLVTIGGTTLTLGRNGIDLSTATADLTINSGVTLLSNTVQSWKVATGRKLTIGGTLTRSVGSTLRFENSGTIQITSGLAGSLLLAGNSPYAVVNGTDFAALDANQFVVPGNTVLTYTVPQGTGNVSISGTITGVVDVQQGTGFRLSNNLTITNGVRFNAAAPAGGWFIDTAATGRLLSTGSILVTADVGPENVTLTGGGAGIRPNGNSGQELILHQYNTAGSLIINNPINNNGASNTVTKDGPGRVILNATMNNTGAYRILEGTLQIGNNTAAGALNAGSSVLNDGTLAFARIDTFNFANSVSGSGGVTQAGSGTLILSGFNLYTGPTQFSAGTVEFSDLLNFGNTSSFNFAGGGLRWATANTTDISTLPVQIAAGGAILDTNGNTVTLANPIGAGGAGGLTKAGAGTLTIPVANTFTGANFVTGGTLRVTNPSGSALGTGALLVSGGGVLTGNGQIAGAVTVQSTGHIAPGDAGIGTLTLGGLSLNAGSVVDFEFSAAPASDRVAVTLADGLTINGGGFNFFTAGTTNGWGTPGTYNLFSYTGAVQGLGPSALSVLNPVTGLDYTFAATGGFVTVTIASSGLVTNWNVNGGGSWGNAANWSNTVPNQASATAKFGSAITTPQTVTLDGSKTVGAIEFDNAARYTIAQGTSGSLTLDRGANPAQLKVVNGSHTISAPVVLASDLGTDIAAGGELRVSGVVSGEKRVTKTGDGALVLSGANSYSAGTEVKGGLVEFATLGNLGTGSVLLDGGGLRLATGSVADISARTVTFGAGGATFDTNGNNVIIAAPIGNAGAGGLIKTGAGTLRLEETNTYLGPTRIIGGSVDILFNGNLGNETTAAAVVLDGGRLTTSGFLTLDQSGLNPRPITITSAGGGIEVGDLGNLTIPGTITGGGILSKFGPGRLLLTGNNSSTFTGGTTIAGGTVELGGGQPNGQQSIGSGPITLRGGGTLIMNGSVNDNTNGWGTLGNALNIPEGEVGNLNMTTRGTLSSALTGSGTLNLRVSFVRGDILPNWTQFTGQINVTSVDGADDLRIAGFVPLNIPDAKLNIGDGVFLYQTFNPPSGTGTETVHNIGELSGTVGAVIMGNPVAGRFADWNVGALGTNSTFAGVMQDTPAAGAARLTKVGGGTLTFSGANTYTGETTIQNGTLLVSGSIAGSTLFNIAGGNLELGADNALSDLGVINMGFGTLDLNGFSDTVGALRLTGFSTLDMGDGASIFQLADSTAEFWSGLLSITGWSGSPAGDGLDQIIFGMGAPGLTPDQVALIEFVNPTGFAPGTYAAQILPSGELVAVPEPAAASLLLAGFGLLLTRHRRRVDQNAV
jgi:fibronectin-binding autotransporter adhesin